MTSDSTKRIFVQIASYRDAECQWTVKDLFEKAKYPERIFVGICWQFDPQKDRACFQEPCPRPGNVRVVNFHPSESRGAGWARCEAQKLWNDEEYILQVQAHMRFEPDWDETLIDMLALCPSEKAVLTAWLPGYRPPDERQALHGGVPRVRVRCLGSIQDPQIIHLTWSAVPQRQIAGTLQPCCSWVGNFMFTHAATLQEVPFDPHIYFWGEELNYSARLWTHGYDIFQCDRVVAWHYWDRSDRDAKDQGMYRNHRERRNQLSFQRNLFILKLRTDAEPEALVEVERYRLGTRRSLEAFWDYTGVNPATGVVQKKALEGNWFLGPASRKPATGTLPRIFVNIASYRDRECQWTVKDLFEKAEHPERVFVGICMQCDVAQDAECFAVAPPRPQQVRLYQCHHEDSKGANWARHQAQKLWQGEEYVLQIDSHMRFAHAWDDTLVGMLARCSAQKPLISAYLPRYEPPDKLDLMPRHFMRMRIREMGRHGDPQLLHITGMPVLRTDARGGLYPTPFWIGNFMFARAQALQEVPFDPHIYFYGDEISFAARLWTHGWDIFQPDRMVAWHYWMRRDAMHLQDYRQPDETRRMRSWERVTHMLGLRESGDPQALAEMERYGLGNVRPLAGLWDFAGVDWQERTIRKESLEGMWGAGKPDAGNRPLPDVSAFAIRSAPSAEKLPRIFVNIASYRDRECQWTVKDLFEKAKYPDRVFVGICWQFDAQEDEDCFQISTRPEQVRVYPVDWREAEGVCWARYITEQLWEGEEYSLQVDAHSRFVKDWDETLLEELALCDSPKPVLSCSPGSYTPPDHLHADVRATVRRVLFFQPDGNIRSRGEILDRDPEKPLNGAFIAAGFIFARAEVLREVPYDPYLYFDQEEITYAIRLYTHGWDVFSARKPYIYHYYNEAKSVRPLHWEDLRQEKAYRDKLVFLQERGIKRFNHLTEHAISNDPGVIGELERFGFGAVRTLKQFEEYTGIDFKRKHVSEKALRCLFIEGIANYRRAPIFIPELDAPGKAKGNPPALKHDLAQMRAGYRPLQEGDYAPLFELQDTTGKIRPMEAHGGYCSVLFFLPGGHPAYVEEFFQEIGTLQPQLQGRLWQLYLMPTSLERVRNVKQRMHLPFELWADGERAVTRAFGVLQAGGGDAVPAAFVFDQNFKILRHYIGLPPHALAHEAVRGLRFAVHVQDERQPRLIREIAPVLMIPDALSEELCRKCIHAFDVGNTFEGTVGAENTLAYRPNAKMRTDFIVQGELLAEIDDKLARSAFPEIHKIFGIEVTHREMYKVGCYKGQKQGFFRAHRDNFDEPLGYRRIAMTIQLNDDYEGGGLVFPEYGPDVYRPRQGGAIAFSCDLMHEALPVQRGNRYVIVAFAHGAEQEAFRRDYLTRKGKPIRARDFAIHPRRGVPGVPQSRDFYRQWKEKGGR